jgi:methionyl-tRNA formyltransferase
MSLRVLFFGMEGVFSRAPLLELIHSSHTVCAIIVPRPAKSQSASEPIRLIAPPRAPESDAKGTFRVPLLFQPRDLNIIGMAWNAGIDVYKVSTLRDERVLARLKQLQPDVIVVACFNQLLPQSLISNLSISHSLNLHPSLLPAYRGPFPLFWIFHDGLEHAGLTVHLMDERADTGDIIAQERVALPDGIRYSDAEKILSEHAARLLVNALGAAQNGTLALTPQPRIAAPLAPNPSERDYVIAQDWDARRAFNFIRGIAEWNHPIQIEVAGARFRVREAISFDEDESASEPLVQRKAQHKIRLARGILTCELF